MRNKYHVVLGSLWIAQLACPAHLTTHAFVAPRKPLFATQSSIEPTLLVEGRISSSERSSYKAGSIILQSKHKASTRRRNRRRCDENRDETTDDSRTEIVKVTKQKTTNSNNNNRHATNNGIHTDSSKKESNSGGVANASTAADSVNGVLRALLNFVTPAQRQRFSNRSSRSRSGDSNARKLSLLPQHRTRILRKQMNLRRQERYSAQSLQRINLYQNKRMVMQARSRQQKKGNRHVQKQIKPPRRTRTLNYD